MKYGGLSFLFAPKNNKLGRITVICSGLCLQQSGTKVIKLFLCSTKLSMKFIMLINVKMPTLLTF